MILSQECIVQNSLSGFEMSHVRGKLNLPFIVNPNFNPVHTISENQIYEYLIPFFVYHCNNKIVLKSPKTGLDKVTFSASKVYFCH